MTCTAIDVHAVDAMFWRGAMGVAVHNKPGMRLVVEQEFAADPAHVVFGLLCQRHFRADAGVHEQ